MSFTSYAKEQANLLFPLVGEKEAMKLADFLKKLNRKKSETNITIVDLSRNGIGNKGATALAEAFRDNLTITTVNLENNRIGPKGVAELAKAIGKNSRINSINLDGNIFYDHLTEIFIDGFKDNSPVTEIFDGGLDNETLIALAELLK